MIIDAYNLEVAKCDLKIVSRSYSESTPEQSRTSSNKKTKRPNSGAGVGTSRSKQYLLISANFGLRAFVFRTVLDVVSQVAVVGDPLGAIFLSYDNVTGLTIAIA